MKTKRFQKSFIYALTLAAALGLLSLVPAFAEEKPVAQVLYTETDNTLTFLSDSRVYVPGDTYNGLEVTQVWSGSDVTVSGQPGWLYFSEDPEAVQRVRINESFASVRPASTADWFALDAVSSLEGLNYLNTSEVTDMSGMFSGISVTSLDLSSFDTSKVTNMAQMFSYCFGLSELDLSGFDTANVTNMAHMFRRADAIETLDLTNFITSKVTDMQYMFEGCSGLKELKIPNFDTSNVTRMDGMFSECEKLEDLDVSHFNTAKVTYMSWMFSGLKKVKTLDVSSFDVSSLYTVDTIFADCESLETVFCKDSDTDWYGAQTPRAAFEDSPLVRGRYGTHVYDIDTGNGLARSAKLGGLFTPKSLTVRFRSNDGPDESEEISARSVFYEAEEVTIHGNPFAREGATFLGWNTKPRATGTAYAPGDKVTLARDLILYAQWDDPGKWTWTRLCGENRFETMREVTLEAFDDGSQENLVVASGVDFADALSGAALAGYLECPVILTMPGWLLDEARMEIERLAAPGCKVYILGGEAAVSRAVERQIRETSNVAEMDRLAGANRELTALNVYEEGKEAWGDTAILATGMDFADTLAISPYAYASKTPILLGRGKGQIGPDVKALFESGAIRKVIIAGGTAAISEETEDYLKSLPGMKVVRLSGVNRFETAAEIVRWETGLKTDAEFQPEVLMTMNGMGVASGMDFPDALGSVSLLGKTKSVLLLTLNPAVARPIVEGLIDELIVPNASGMKKGYIFGGSAAVDPGIETLLNKAVER
ncbi:MAG: BspA family leucine-rich repeat surface protein [Lachnospiraceae bacterium]|nr:BspA family leucine-rich repeat surface protein [Lachnospiraceae bacterium]